MLIAFIILLYLDIDFRYFEYKNSVFLRNHFNKLFLRYALRRKITLLSKETGCKVVVLDFDMHMSESILKTKKIVSGLFGRHEDFNQRTLEECYVVHNSKAVVVKSDDFAGSDKDSIKQIINDVIERLRT